MENEAEEASGAERPCKWLDERIAGRLPSEWGHPFKM